MEKWSVTAWLRAADWVRMPDPAPRTTVAVTGCVSFLRTRIAWKSRLIDRSPRWKQWNRYWMPTLTLSVRSSNTVPETRKTQIEFGAHRAENCVGLHLSWSLKHSLIGKPECFWWWRVLINIIFMFFKLSTVLFYARCEVPETGCLRQQAAAEVVQSWRQAVEQKLSASQESKQRHSEFPKRSILRNTFDDEPY